MANKANTLLWEQTTAVIPILYIATTEYAMLLNARFKTATRLCSPTHVKENTYLQPAARQQAL